MENFKKGFVEKIKRIEQLSRKTDDCEQEIGRQLEGFVKRARDILKKKHAINPKPHKKMMRAIVEDESGGDESEKEKEKVEFAVPHPPKLKPLAESTVIANNNSFEQNNTGIDRDSLRPIRSAKLSAKNNLKEVPMNSKMRNDNNVAVVVKQERISNIANKSGSRDSLKENSQPVKQQQQRISVDEGVQMSSEFDVQSEQGGRGGGRSMSVEFVPTKDVQIDITDDSAERMPPPPLPTKKKTRQKQSKQSDLPADPKQPIPTRITRSKIKTEKASIDRTTSAPLGEKTTKDTTDHSALQRSASETVISHVETTSVAAAGGKKKGKNKKYPEPIIVKVERLSTPVEEQQPQQQEQPQEKKKISKKTSIEVPQIPATINGFPMNETVTLSTNTPNNETVTISKTTPVNETVTIETHNNINNETVTLERNENGHDSLMTDDNDDDVSMTESQPTSAPKISSKEKAKPSKTQQPQLLPLKLKKNEVFNPYLSSPVKQKVQAFEKHSTMQTPEVSKASSSKYHTLKSGTPSKIGVYSSKTTPLNNAKQRYISAVASSATSSSTATLSSTKSSAKKFTSLTTTESDEKKKQHEEKLQKVKLQREAIEKQKREQTILAQREREEKFRKIMLEKEENKRLEALKKKQLKENQEKKYAEEKLRKEEFVVPKEPQSASKDNSLYIKMQKQIMIDKTAAVQQQQQQKQKKKHDANAYSFEMLNTDDSTDDESKPSKKRPDPPQWSRKSSRAKQIQIQSFANSCLLDTLFSAQPITVDLKQIFPSIDSRKLVRNSSAVWNTPPRYSQMPKY